MKFVLKKPIERSDVGCRLPMDALVKQSNGVLKAPPEGTVLRGLHITNGWYLRNPGITFIDCVIDAHNTSYGINAVKGRVTVEHCTFRGGNSAAINAGSGSRISRCLISDNMSDGAKLEGGCVFEYNWIELLGGPDNPSAHADGIQAHKGSNTIVRHNVFDMPVGLVNEKGKYRNSACLMLQEKVSAWDIYGNWFAGGHSRDELLPKGRMNGFLMQITSPASNRMKLHDNVFVRGSGRWHMYREIGELDAYNNRYAETGEVFDKESNAPSLPQQPDPDPQPDPIQPEPVPQLPEETRPTWKVYNADGTVTERWK